MFKAKLVACLAIFTFVGLSCAIPGQPVATVVVIPPAPAQAGIDMPKEGDVIPLSPYEIVYHGADFTEVKQLELAINSVPVTIQANPAPGTGFVLMRYVWTPRRPVTISFKPVLRTRMVSGDPIPTSRSRSKHPTVQAPTNPGILLLSRPYQ